MESLSSFDPFKFGSKRNNLLTAHKTNFLSDPGSGTPNRRKKRNFLSQFMKSEIIKMSKKDDIKADEAATTCQALQKEESQLDKGHLISK